MATHTMAAGEVSSTFTLAAATVDTVTVSTDTDTVTILSDGTAAVWYTVDGTDPTVAGVNAFPIPAALSTFEVGRLLGFTGTLKLISAGTPTLTVYRSA